jgi:ribose transport system permease protein
VKDFGNLSMIGPVPWLIVPMTLASVGMWYLLNHLRIGRYILAVGNSQHAAELSGINQHSTITWAHAISGLLAAVGGIMLVAKLQIGQPTIGDDWLISSFAAPVIGGAVLSGGHVSVAGTFFGVVIIAIITQALVLFNIDPYLVQVVLGGLILWAVGINRWREMRVAKLQEQGR